MPSPAPDGFTVARVTIDLDLWADVRAEALRKSLPVSDIVADALADWLRHQRTTRAAAAAQQSVPA